MFTKYRIKWVKGHILINDDQGLLIDTGSPVSIHTSGVINICGQKINVQSHLAGTNIISSLKKEISNEVNGLIGMDILSVYPILFNLHNGGDFIFLDDDAQYTTQKIESFSIMDKYCGMFIDINKERMKLVFDAGAPISYVNSKRFCNHKIIRRQHDFSPVLGKSFIANIIKLPISVVANESREIEFGYSEEVDFMLYYLNIDGILGTAFLREYRVQMRNRTFYLPPQGI